MLLRFVALLRGVIETGECGSKNLHPLGRHLSQDVQSWSTVSYKVKNSPKYNIEFSDIKLCVDVFC